MKYFVLSTVAGLLACLLFSVGADAQAKPTTTPSPISQGRSSILSTPAFAEILLRRTELEAELESQLSEYTEDYPKVKELRFEVSALQKAAGRVLAVKPEETDKLTLALGKLIVRKCELEAELWKLESQYKDGHPDVKRARKKVEIFEKAIKDILG